MNKLRILMVFLVIAVLAMPAGGAALAQDGNGGEGGSGRFFVAVLRGENETPPVETDAQGISFIALNPDQTSLSYFVHVVNIENVAAAHIHCGAPGVPGPVVVPLYPVEMGPYSGDPTSPGQFFVAGTAGEEDVVTLPDSPECPGGIASFAELVAKMLAGETYVNVHTSQNPGGEVRGQNIRLGSLFGK